MSIIDSLFEEVPVNEILNDTERDATLEDINNSFDYMREKGELDYVIMELQDNFLEAKRIYEDKGDRSLFTDNVEKFINGLASNKDKLPDGCKLSVSRLARYIKKDKYD